MIEYVYRIDTQTKLDKIRDNHYRARRWIGDIYNRKQLEQRLSEQSARVGIFTICIFTNLAKAITEVILNKQSTFETAVETSILVPLVGTIRAGCPETPIEDIEDYIRTDPSWLRGNGCFFLRVKGDSMVDAHILSGDLALIRPQSTAENSNVVVAYT